MTANTPVEGKTYWLHRSRYLDMTTHTHRWSWGWSANVHEGQGGFPGGYRLPTKAAARAAALAAFEAHQTFVEAHRG